VDEKTFRNQYLGELPPLEKTDHACSDCDFSDMQVLSISGEFYPKYRCPICYTVEDTNPRAVALMRKIDIARRRPM